MDGEQQNHHTAEASTANRPEGCLHRSPNKCIKPDVPTRGPSSPSTVHRPPAPVQPATSSVKSAWKCSAAPFGSHFVIPNPVALWQSDRIRCGAEPRAGGR